MPAQRNFELFACPPDEPVTFPRLPSYDGLAQLARQNAVRDPSPTPRDSLMSSSLFRWGHVHISCLFVDSALEPCEPDHLSHCFPTTSNAVVVWARSCQSREMSLNRQLPPTAVPPFRRARILRPCVTHCRHTATLTASLNPMAMVWVILLGTYLRSEFSTVTIQRPPYPPRGPRLPDHLHIQDQEPRASRIHSPLKAVPPRTCRISTGCSSSMMLSTAETSITLSDLLSFLFYYV